MRPLRLVSAARPRSDIILDEYLILVGEARVRPAAYEIEPQSDSSSSAAWEKASICAAATIARAAASACTFVIWLLV